MLPPPVMLFSSVKEVRMPRLRMAMTIPRTGIVRRWFSGSACHRPYHCCHAVCSSLFTAHPPAAFQLQHDRSTAEQSAAYRLDTDSLYIVLSKSTISYPGEKALMLGECKLLSV